jgi:hypothetical protein
MKEKHIQYDEAGLRALAAATVKNAVMDATRRVSEPHEYKEAQEALTWLENELPVWCEFLGASLDRPSFWRELYGRAGARELEMALKDLREVV